MDRSRWNTHTQPFYGPFSGTTRVSRCQKRNFWTLWCKGRLMEADTLTIRLGATLSGLSSAHLHHPPCFFTCHFLSSVSSVGLLCASVCVQVCVCVYVCVCVSVYVCMCACVCVCCSDFRQRSELFLRSFDGYLSTRDDSDSMLNK